MNTSASGIASRKPLRVWPGVVAAVALLLLRFGVKAVVPGFTGFARGMMWSFWAAGAVLLWWLLLSRARWFERLGGLALIAAGLGVAWQLRHPSMSLLWVFAYAVPSVCLALVAGATLARRLPDGPRRRATLAAAILLASCSWLLVRTEGVSGDHVASFGWRWTKSSEEKLLAQESVARLAPAPSPVPAAAPAPAATPEPAPAKAPSKAPEAPHPSPSAPPAQPTKPDADWPGFRGPGRDGVVHGPRIATDWAASPPVELWRRAVGPGWSSFAVSGGFVYTQEQRGADEVVSCYEEATGAPVWTHKDAVRFFESNGGPGPRGTPTLAGGRIYTLGATGILNALDAGDGSVAWSRAAASDAEGTPSMGGGGTIKVPDWGFSSSPLVVDDLVVVAMAGQLVAYDLATGKPRWTGPKGGVSYSSPQLATIGGVPQVLLASATGLTSVSPADGQPLWQHVWRGFPIVQPAFTPDGGVLARHSQRQRHAPPRGRAGERRLDRRGALDLAGAQALLQRLRRPRRPRVRLRRPHPRVHRPRERRAPVEGRTLRQRPARAAGRPGPAARAVGRGRARARQRDARRGSPRSRGSRRVQGKTWNHPALAGDTLWFGTARRWSRSACRSPVPSRSFGSARSSHDP